MQQKQNAETALVAGKEKTTKLGHRRVVDQLSLRPKHVGSSAASFAVLQSLNPGASFSGFGSLEVAPVYVRLAAAYTDPFNWFFEVAVQPVAIAAQPGGQAISAVLKFVRSAARCQAFLEGVLFAAEELGASADDSPELRAQMMNKMLQARVIEPKNINKHRQHHQRKVPAYDPMVTYVTTAPGNVVLAAAALHTDMLNDVSHQQGLNRRLRAPWQRAEVFAPDEERSYLHEDVDAYIAAWGAALQTAGDIGKVDGSVWPIGAVTPRPPSAEDRSPSMAAWVECHGWKPDSIIWKLRVSLKSGVLHVQKCIPEVRFNGRDGEVYQNMAEPQNTRVVRDGKQVVVPMPRWHAMVGLPPLAAADKYLTGKFVKRHDILQSAPELAAWLISDKSAQPLACLQHMAQVAAADRAAFAEVGERYLADQSLSVEDKQMLASYAGAAFLLYLQAKHSEQLQMLREAEEAAKMALQPVALVPEMGEDDIVIDKAPEAVDDDEMEAGEAAGLTLAPASDADDSELVIGAHEEEEEHDTEAQLTSTDDEVTAETSQPATA